MPKISIIIPIYGVEKYIECCAISLLEQTLDDIEFIFIEAKEYSIIITYLEKKSMGFWEIVRELYKKSERIVISTNGFFTDRIVDLCVELRKADLEIKTIQMIRDCENEDAHGILIEAVKQGKPHCIVKSEHIVKR